MIHRPARLAYTSLPNDDGWIMVINRIPLGPIMRMNPEQSFDEFDHGSVSLD